MISVVISWAFEPEVWKPHYNASLPSDIFGSVIAPSSTFATSLILKKLPFPVDFIMIFLTSESLLYI
jgi:hypothetical protein